MTSALPWTLALSALAGCTLFLEPRDLVGSCGDGVLQTGSGEECDDANSGAGDGCSPACTVERCGNKVEDFGEECDLGELDDDSGDCTRDCRRARCGDGHLKSRGMPPLEVCDDGNTINGDGCSPDCSLRGRVSILAGSPGGMGIADGIGASARFGGVEGVAANETFVYLADTRGCTIRRMEIASGEVRTIAGIPGTCGVLADGDGPDATFSGNTKTLALAGDALYVGEGNTLRRIDLTPGGAFRVATCPITEGDASLSALVADPSGSRLYVARQTRIDALPLPCACAGDGRTARPCVLEPLVGNDVAGYRPGVGTAAGFELVKSLAIRSSELFASDACRIRRVDLQSRRVTDVPGAGCADRGLVKAVAVKGDLLYAVEQTVGGGVELGFARVAVLDLNGAGGFRVLAGAAGSVLRGEASEVDGFGSFSRILEPWAIAISGDVLFIGETASLRALSLETSQLVTVAGQLVRDFRFYGTRAIASGRGVVYAPNQAGQILEIPQSLSKPVRVIDLCADRPDALHLVSALLLDDATSSLFVMDAAQNALLRIDVSDEARPCAVELTLGELDGFFQSLAGDEDFFYLLRNLPPKAILRVDRASKSVVDMIPLPRGALNVFSLVAARASLYATAREDNVILRIDPRTGDVRPLGDGVARTRNSETLATASFCHPAGIATDGYKLFVGEAHCVATGGEFQGHALRQIDLASGHVSTLVGPGPRPFVVEGTGHQGSLNFPGAVSFDVSTGTLYVADFWDNVLLRVD